jgi:pimeloyl-ACP methyl ester carboxylesterase
MEPVRGYARSGDVQIAYQVLGQGPLDTIHTLPFAAPMEVGWELPQIARYLTRFASFSRTIVFDQRSTGASDRTGAPPTLEEQVADLGAVVDAVEARDLALVGCSQTAASTIVYARRNPDRVKRLVLISATARSIVADDYPTGATLEQMQDLGRRIAAAWGTGATLDLWAPSVADDLALREWVGRAERTLGTPQMAERFLMTMTHTDVREDARALTVPTLVVHRKRDRTIPVAHARWLAQAIPGATLVELPGPDHPPYLGDTAAVVDAVEQWLTGTRHSRVADRVLAALLFTDIAGSTARAAELGDSSWRVLLERHDLEVRRQIARHEGIERNTAGDGFLAEFGTASAAIAAAREIVESVARLGLDVRAGIHTTECERIDDNLGGLGVHVAARVAGLAEGGEVLVSGTVADVVAGSAIALREHGVHDLKGVPGRWPVFRVICG